jgi:predicted RNA-binding Zn-ribbon protein involved in translation (DUF1610 family)
MSCFKYKFDKPVKEKTSNNRKNTTLYSKHKEKMKMFTDNNYKLPDLKDNLESLKNDLSKIESREVFGQTVTKKRADIKEKIDKLENNIFEIENSFHELDYFSNVGYEISEYHKSENVVETDARQIFEFLDSKNHKPKDITKPNKTKKELFELYLLKTEGISLENYNEKDRIKKCYDCGIEQTLQPSSGMYSCTECGNSEIVIVDEDNQIKDYSAYKRINHFTEWLNQFQGKESTDIPNSVYEEIVKDMNRRRIKDRSVLEPKIMREILKKLKMHKYYEHTIYIINKLNNIPPPKIDRETEKLFKKMFIKIQKPFIMFKPVKRKNFLSYAYVLYKFCELLELDEFLPYFPLLKSNDKLQEQDEIWEKICNYLNWDFYSSFK